MGENEQGGMLRTVVVIGLIALIAAVIIGGVVAVKASMIDHQTTALQSISKANSQKDIDFKLIGDNGQLTSLTSKTDLVNSAYLTKVVSGNNTKGDTNYLTRPFDATNTQAGIQMELYFEGSKIGYIYGNSSADYYELSIDYKVVGGQSVTFDQAKALNLDSQRAGDSSHLRIGLRSDEWGWSKYGDVKLDGTKEGTLTMTAPKSTTGATYEAYIVVSNTNFKHLELSNLRISNASH